MGFPFSFLAFRQADANHGWNGVDHFDISVCGEGTEEQLLRPFTDFLLVHRFWRN